MNRVWCLWTAALVATLVVSAGGQLTELTEAESCFEGAQQSAQQSEDAVNGGRPPMAGGYSEIDDPSSDQNVMSVAQLAMTRLNGLSNNGYTLDTSTDEELIAFSQVRFLLHRVPKLATPLASNTLNSVNYCHTYYDVYATNMCRLNQKIV